MTLCLYDTFGNPQGCHIIHNALWWILFQFILAFKSNSWAALFRRSRIWLVKDLTLGSRRVSLNFGCTIHTIRGHLRESFLLWRTCNDFRSGRKHTNLWIIWSYTQFRFYGLRICGLFDYLDHFIPIYRLHGLLFYGLFAYMDHFSRDKRGPYIRNWVYM